MQRKGRLESSQISRRTTKKINSDLIDPARSALMARVRQKHSGPELEVRRLLRGLGASYKLHPKSLPGTPDIVVTEAKCAIFVHGCFWHRHPSCVKASTPKTRTAFWTEKFAQNVARDARKTRALRKLGWSVMTIWECQCRDVPKLEKRLRHRLAG